MLREGACLSLLTPIQLTSDAQELDSTDEEHAAWWESLLTVCEAELKEAKKQDDLDRARLRGERALEAKRQREVGVHTAVDVEIQGLLSGASTSALQHS